MLEGCRAWPEEFARLYREKGHWEDITLWQMLERVIARAPDKIAIVCRDRRTSYRDLGERIGRVAGGLAAAGLRPRDRVVMQLPNGLDLVVTFFALLRIGVIPVLALPAHRADEVAYFVKHADAVAYFGPDRLRDFDYRPMAADIARRSPSLRLTFIAGEPWPGQVSLADMARPGGVAEGEIDALAPPADDVALMLLSGGTTGVPKLIPRTHNDYVYNCRQCGRIAGFGPETVFLAVLPMSHNYTLGCPGVLGALAAGGTAVIVPDASAETVFPLIGRERVTVISGAMPLVVNWLAGDAPERHDLSSLEVFMSGGAKLAPELRARVERRLNCIYQESFGTGEGLISMTRLDDPEEIRMTSSGRPVSPGDEIKVIDEQGRELPDGAVGELVCRGPYTIRGYYRAPTATAAAFTADGFYRMGDAVRKIGDDLYVEGRLKDLINRGGEKISCEEVENHLLAHPRIKSACVVAMPDPTYGEKACAFVMPAGEAEITLEEIKSFLLGRAIAKFKMPERVEVVCSFPTSPAGKILRRELRRMIETKLSAERNAAEMGVPASDASGKGEIAT
ncbi:MAG: (2,3-dihydroxybenzoyl)adenylate synthase [Rhodoplanes sp.]